MNLLTKIRTLRQIRPAREPELPDVAHAVAIIMDGNARWAKKRGLPIAAGHRAGTKALRRTVEAAIEESVPAPIITLSLLMRFVSRQEDSYSAKVIAALRAQFGGHAVKTESAATGGGG